LPHSPLALAGLPGTKYPHLFAFYAFPLPGHTPQEMADAIHVEIERLKKEDISDDELKMIKTRAKANLIRGLADNEGLATQLATYQTRYGDWREVFRSVDRIDKVTKEDIRRVANETFNDTNRTVGVIETATSVGPGHGANSGGKSSGEPDSSSENKSDQGRCAMSSKICSAIKLTHIASLLILSFIAISRCGPCARTGHKLQRDSYAAIACIPSGAAQTHSTLEWYGDFPARRS
jgi:hypothetical protein